MMFFTLVLASCVALVQVTSIFIKFYLKDTKAQHLGASDTKNNSILCNPVLVKVSSSIVKRSSLVDRLVAAWGLGETLREGSESTRAWCVEGGDR